MADKNLEDELRSVRVKESEQTYFQKKLFDTIKMCDIIINMNPENYDAHLTKADTLMELNNYQEAIVLYKQAIRINPDSESAWLKYGIALEETENITEAKDAYEEVKRINPKNQFVKNFNTKQNISSRRNGIQEILEAKKGPSIITSKYKQINPNNNPQTEYNNLCKEATRLAEKGNCDDAIKAYEQAMKINPNDFAIKEKLNALIKK